MTIIPNKWVKQRGKRAEKKEKLSNYSWQVPFNIRVVDEGERSILQVSLVKSVAFS